MANVLGMHHCERCGAEFVAYGRRRFCGRDCANKTRGAGAERWAVYSCERCGAPVRTKPRYIGRYRFCHTCRHRESAERTVRQRPRHYAACVHCGSPFYQPPSLASKRACSIVCAAALRVGIPSTKKRPAALPQTSGGVGGFRADLGFAVRSRWEANYARYLRATGVSFVYEPHRFNVRLSDGSERSYLPDFLVDGRYYVEIKAWERPERREGEVLLAAGEQLPLPLLVVRPVHYREIEAAFAARIPEWEHRNSPRPVSPQRP